MNTLRWILVALALLVLLVWLAGRFGALRGHPPSDLGVRDGRLKAPARTPNSVSSQADLHPQHPMREYASIAALPASGGASASMARVRAVVERMPGATVVEQRDDYLYAQFETSAMRFVDDVEFWYDPRLRRSPCVRRHESGARTSASIARASRRSAVTCSAERRRRRPARNTSPHRVAAALEAGALRARVVAAVRRRGARPGGRAMGRSPSDPRPSDGLVFVAGLLLGSDRASDRYTCARRHPSHRHADDRRRHDLVAAARVLAVYTPLAYQ